MPRLRASENDARRQHATDRGDRRGRVRGAEQRAVLEQGEEADDARREEHDDCDQNPHHDDDAAPTRLLRPVRADSPSISGHVVEAVS